MAGNNEAGNNDNREVVQDVAEGDNIPVYVQLQGAIVIIGHCHIATVNATMIPARWNGREFGSVFYGLTEVDGARGIFIDMATYNELKNNGFRHDIRETWAPITDISYIRLENPMIGLGYSMKRFLPIPLLHTIAEGLLRARTVCLPHLKSLLRVTLNMTDEEIVNQLRFSFCCLMPKMKDRLNRPMRNNVSIIQEPEGGWVNFRDQLIAIFSRGERNDPYLFKYREEAEFAIILSVHCNSKKYTSDNYAKTMKKTMQTYYSREGYHFGGDISRPFLAHLFSVENIRSYHDYIPKQLRKALYEGLKTASDAEYPYKSYLYNSLMAWNSMSLIRETYRVVFMDQPRKFLFLPAYISQIKTFMTWWNLHHSNKQQELTFPYTWYHNPEILYEVSHAKLPNLYSLVLKVAQLNKQMTHYRASNLDPGTINDDDIMHTNSLTSERAIEQVDDGNLALIGRRQINNVNQGQDMVAMFAALMQQYKRNNQN